MPTETSGERPQPPSPAGLCSWTFVGLLITQFLGAMNDNVFRWLAVGIAKSQANGAPGEEASATAALTIGAVCLVLPFLLFAGHAGYLADRFSKRWVIVGCKLLEVLIAIAGVFVLAGQHVPSLFAVLFMFGVQSALFGPAKLGSIPEMLRADRISAANGLVGLSTVLAVVLGTVVGNYLNEPTEVAQWLERTLGPARFDASRPLPRVRLEIASGVLLAIAGLGLVTSLLVARLPAAAPRLPFPWNPFGKAFADFQALARDRAMLRVALGITFFWALASLAQLNVDAFGSDVLGLAQPDIGPLLALLSFGVGLGSLFAGFLSRGRVELGLVPLGALGMVASLAMVYFSGASYAWSAAWLFLLGTSAGVFSVPLAAYMQHRSPVASRGAILAAGNFLTFLGILLSSGLFYLLRAPFRADGGALYTPGQVFLIAGAMTLPVAIYALTLLPQATMRFVVLMASWTCYRVRVHGIENLPPRGGALLVANHVSWLDGIFLLMVSSRPIRMVAFADYVDKWWSRWVIKAWGVIAIKPGRRSVVESLRLAREAVRAGDLVCIFPEGGLTRSGQLMSFKPGFLTILKDTGAPLIPIYLDELWGSIFSFERGKFFWKWPRRWPYPVSILIGQPIAAADEAWRVRRTVEELGEQAVQERRSRSMVLSRQFLRMCRRSRFRSKAADSLGAELTGGDLLLRSLILKRLLEREVLAPDEQNVGVLLPPSVGALVVNAALPLLRRTSVNLNYTVSSEIMNACIRQAGIRHVLTTRKFLDKLALQLDAEVVFIEELRDRVRLSDKLCAAVSAHLEPLAILERRLGLHRVSPDDVLTIIFTSGSTGEPKGVMLSYHNVGSNIEAIDQIIHLHRNDVLCGILPFFHSFGYTTTLWTVLTLDPKGVYHFSPLDPRQVGELCRQHRATILIATPTFLRTYLRRCNPEDFAALDVVLAGAEKLPKDLCDAFEAKFGVRPVEGYGTTELSPLVSVNVPQSRSQASDGSSLREGTVGRPVPGVCARVVNTETGEVLGLDTPGMLLIRGPNVMRGYIGRPDLTAQVIRDGWYVTGDIATIDADGFIKITGRESRFSKIGGEMVPHVLVEEHLQRLLSQDEEELKAVVAGVPDPRKGERLVVLHTSIDKSPAEIVRLLADAGLPNLWIPAQDSFAEIEQIPVLGTGKLDLKAIRTLALEKFAPDMART